MTSLVVAEDAGLTDGNADAVLIADFPDAEAFSRYAQDPSTSPSRPNRCARTSPAGAPPSTSRDGGRPVVGRPGGD